MAVRIGRTIVCVLLALVCTPGGVGAHGGLPKTMSMATQPGDDDIILVGTTFGPLISRDDGVTFGWTCEAAVGYTEDWDPVHAIAATGTMFSTIDDGIAISRDGGCSWDEVGDPIAGAPIPDLAVDAVGAIWAVSSRTSAMNDVYVSRDDGVTFVPSNAMLDQGFWRAVRPAPSDPMRVYVSGYVLGDPTPIGVVRRSDDGGATWTDLPWTGSAQVRVAGVSATDPDVVLVRIDGAPDDQLVRSIDGGMTWEPEPVLALPGHIRLAGAPDGTTWIAGVPGTDVGIVRISHDGGATWTPTAQQPVLGCVHIRPSDGDFFACGDNWDPDRFAVARSADGESWTKIYRFIETTQLDCPASSEHAAVCTPEWPSILGMFGIGAADAGPPDGGDSGADGGGGCGCGVGFAAIVLVLPRRRRRDAR